MHWVEVCGRNISFCGNIWRESRLIMQLYVDGYIAFVELCTLLSVRYLLLLLLCCVVIIVLLLLLYSHIMPMRKGW